MVGCGPFCEVCLFFNTLASSSYMRQSAQPVHHFGPNWCNSTNVGWITMGVFIRTSPIPRIWLPPTDFGDRLNFFFEFLQILAKLSKTLMLMFFSGWSVLTLVIPWLFIQQHLHFIFLSCFGSWPVKHKTKGIHQPLVHFDYSTS